MWCRAWVGVTRSQQPYAAHDGASCPCIRRAKPGFLTCLQTYKFKGRLIGRFYTQHGQPRPALHKVERLVGGSELAFTI